MRFWTGTDLARPEKVMKAAAEHAILVNFRTPRAKVLEAIELAYPRIKALEFPGDHRIRIHFDRIGPAVIALDKQARLLDVLRWYLTYHSAWFEWLEIVPPGGG